MIGMIRLWQRLNIYVKYELAISPHEFRGGVLLLVLLLTIGGLRKALYSRNVPPEVVVEAAPLPVTRFNPDTVSSATLRAWGLPPKLARGWENYRAAIGGFRTSSQVKKLYGMTDSIFQLLGDSMVFESSRAPLRRCPEPLDINLADSALFRRLHGIGGVLSSRIVRYRELLGGFVSPNQVGEVYGIRDSTWLHIKDKLYVERGFQPTRLSLDTASYIYLYDHPYISSREATSIIRYRERHEGKVALDEIISFDSLRRERLKPYVIPAGDNH